MKTRICSHRGLTSKYQENTLDAIQAAVDIGIDMVEFDTISTKDEVWILHHDPYLGRKDNLIRDLRYDEVVEFKENQGLKIDLLEDLTKRFKETHLNYELKLFNKQGGMKFAKFLEDNNPVHPYNVSSFSLPALEGVHKINKNIDLSYLGYIMPFIKWRWALRKIPLLSINPYVRFVNPRAVEAAHRRDIQVHVFTVNQKQDIIRLLEANTDVIITDKPELALKLREDYINIVGKIRKQSQ